ncbi:PTS lactose/cellobiose transporter subunit IIA [Tyzzerella sp. An114]|uniref:PTS lactose/cellobiose transporter subunit IIA n=1 Tax=Tyzzerella sp. An114 TaxID=1965545 RepID=UPI000B4532BD|nr:PTS lactose/cellobiose transporter subunit IIA [Tyzzerella sp. An114]OUQ59550.1 PTS lactose/cellobiose transporter subunit IIA [Tyzzerella sp. An114]
MVDIEKVSMTAMEIITYAGLAKSNYLMALKDYKAGKKDEAFKKIEEGSAEFAKAHEVHSKVLTDEMEKLEPQVCLLLVHAEDQLMGAESIRLLVEELIELYGEREK